MQNQKGNIVLIIAGIVAVAILAGGVGYFVAKKPAQKEEQKQEKQQEQQKSISEMTEQKTEQPEAKDETADWKTYRNEKYGFEIMLNDFWKGYEVIEESDKKFGTTNRYLNFSLRFDIPNKSNWYPLTIYIISKTEWYKLPEDMPKPIYITENNADVFSYRESQDVPEGFISNNLRIQEVISTFKFIK